MLARVRHRIDGLEKSVRNFIGIKVVRHRIDGLEKVVKQCGA